MVPDIPYQENYQKLKDQLRKKDFLASLTDAQIERFATNAAFEEHKQGTIIIRQGEKGTGFYYILGGQVRVIDESGEIPRLINYIGEGEFFGERALIFSEPRAATVDVAVDVIVAKFNIGVWQWLISIEPKLDEEFRVLEKKYESNSAIPFPGRHADEVAIIKINRHILAFIITLVGPLALMLFVLILAWLFTDIGLFTPTINYGVAAAITFLCVLWIIYNYVEWNNDDFIVSTKRVIHIERNILAGEHREESPLTQVLDVYVNTPNFFARVFDYSHVEINSYGLGTIRFDGVQNGTEITQIIFQQIDLAKERVKADDLASIRKQLASQIGYQGKLEADRIAPVETDAPKKRINWRLPRIIHYFLPIVREESQDVVIWRKHFLVWFKGVWLPGLVSIGTFILLVGSIFGFINFNVWLAAIIYGVSLFWYTYMHDDWRKDVYMLTNEKIIHRDSTAFRLRGETYRETVFANVQNIDYISPNFISRMLNMGDVIITTAAVTERFKFTEVYYPRDVQQEIFRRWVAYNESLRKDKRADEENRFSTWLGEYYRLLQLHEQDEQQKNSKPYPS